MIRDKTKIYGEPNNPNTVLANGLLNSGHLIIGDGGKKIKEFVVPNKSLIYGTGSGIASFNYGVANKIIGTDANGFLVLKDQIKTIIKNFGGTNNEFNTSDFKFYDSSGNDISSSYTVTLGQAGYPNVSYVTLNGELANISNLDILFPLAKQFVCNSNSINIILSLNYELSRTYSNLLFTEWDLLYSAPGSSEITEIALNGVYSINESLSIPIGSTIKGLRGKKQLTITDTQQVFYFFVNFSYTEGGA